MSFAMLFRRLGEVVSVTEQYQRVCKLTVSGSGGGVKNLSELRVTFQINHAVVQTPKAAWIRVYNVSQSTIAQVQKEFTAVSLTAGYVGNAAVIFSGTIKFIRAGRETQTDTFLDIFAADGDEAYNQANVNVSLAAGWTDQHVYDACLNAMAPFGIGQGHVPPLSGTAALRGAAFYGPAKSVLTDMAARNGCNWNIAQGQLNLIPIGQAASGTEAIVLNSNTGMVGIPKQTVLGVEVTALLNPLIRPGSLVQIAAADVLGATPDLASASLQPLSLPSIASAGLYAVQWVDLEGDTRGQPWYTHAVCASANPNDQQPFTKGVAENLGF